MHVGVCAGRVACEIQSADELVLTELIFNGVFSALSGEQIVALTSCFVWSEKSDIGVKVQLHSLSSLASNPMPCTIHISLSFQTGFGRYSLLS